MADANRSGNSRKTRVEPALPNTYFEISESAGKRRKRCVDRSKDRSRQTCLVHGPGCSSDEFKVLAGFGDKYSKIRPTKDHGHEPATKNKFNRQKEKNYIVNHAVDEIILQDNNKGSDEYESHENIDSKINENDLYDIDNMSLD